MRSGGKGTPGEKNRKILRPGRPLQFATVLLSRARARKNVGRRRHEKDMKKTDIKNGLIKQLEAKGAKTPHFMSLIEDYMFLHDQVQKMKKSIKEDGVEYEATSAAGKTYMKENPAIKNIILYNRQMLAIIKELGLSTDEAGEPEDDEL